MSRVQEKEANDPEEVNIHFSNSAGLIPIHAVAARASAGTAERSNPENEANEAMKLGKIASMADQNNGKNDAYNLANAQLSSGCQEICSQ